MDIQQFAFLKHLLRIKRQVYLDYNATTRVNKHVRRVMNKVLKHHYGNPSSLYAIGRQSVEVIEEARQQVADAINASADEICFTGCATESNNALLQTLSRYHYPAKKKIIATPIEHPSVLETLQFLQAQGIDVAYCPVDRHGHVIISELEKLIDDSTFLICCMLANNELGSIQDIPTISRLAKQHNLLMMSDCVQAFGKIPIDVHGWGIDYASFSAHKLHGPKGVGALYIRKGSPFEPFIHGGHQEGGMRGGTESLHNIAGFGAACQRVDKLLAHSKHTRRLKKQFIEQLKRLKPDCVINSPAENCLPNTLNIRLPDVNNAALLAMFDYHSIAISAGSACNSDNSLISSTLKAVGLTEDQAGETVRISMGPQNSIKEIRYTIKVLGDFLKHGSKHINMISPARVSESVLTDGQFFILDVRPQYQRKKVKGLPNCYEASFISINKYMPLLPRDKHIVVVCQHGNLSYVVAYYLREKGFEQVSSLQGGTVAWQARHPELYETQAGQNITVLQPKR